VLSGTSQAAAVVSGVAAQMIQANPRMTPNLIKAILEYTAQEYDGLSPLEQGAGFLNALGAVRLSRFYATAHPGQHVPVEPIWSKHFIWGNHELSGGLMLPSANAWHVGVLWGAPKTAGNDGDNIVWGTDNDFIDWGIRTPPRLPDTEMEWFGLFLNRQFDLWVSREFGDSFMSNEGRDVFATIQMPRRRTLPQRYHYRH
jgi:hypothetical protein